MHGFRRTATALATVLSVVMVTLFAALPAAAEDLTAGPVATPVDGTGTATLAATGLDLAVPLIIGITGLLLGMALIGWGMLRRGNSRH